MVCYLVCFNSNMHVSFRVEGLFFRVDFLRVGTSIYKHNRHGSPIAPHHEHYDVEGVDPLKRGCPPRRVEGLRP